MSIELVSFVFGAVLLGVAVIGGGFEVKEIKLPRVGLVPRVVSFVLGAAFITFGALGYDALANRGAPPQPSGVAAENRGVLPDAAAEQPLSVTIEGPATAPLGQTTYYRFVSAGALRGEWSIGGFTSAPVVVDPLQPVHEIYVEPSDPERVGDRFTVTVYGASGRSASSSKSFVVVSE